MEKLRILVFTVILLIIAILTFSLSKSWIIYEKGVEITKENSEKEEEAVKEKPEPTEDVSSYSKILWGQFLYFPVGLSKEAGGIGPEEVLSHAKNLVFINLQNGKKEKLFKNQVYIWDFFPGEFKRKLNSSNKDEPVFESLNIPGKIIIIAMNEDTNKDGFLNHRDYKKIFMYDPYTEQLEAILPKGYHMEKIYLNTKLNLLTLLVRNMIEVETEPEKSKDTKKVKIVKPNNPVLFVYNAATKKGQIVSPD